jgi:hypothetical protein
MIVSRSRLMIDYPLLFSDDTMTRAIFLLINVEFLISFCTYICGIILEYHWMLDVINREAPNGHFECKLIS